MKNKKTSAVVVVIGLLVGFLLPGCASTSIKQLSGTEFVNQAAQIEQINSFHWTTYVGSSHDRAYLQYGHPAFIGGGVRTTVYWTPLSELPASVAQKLKTGEAPWKQSPSKAN